MITIFCELFYWTLKNDILIDTTDFSSFKYNEKKETELSTNKIIKKNYVEARGYSWSLSNKRPKKLKDCLKNFEADINDNHLIAVEWLKKDKIAFIFSNGITTFITFDTVTCDILEIVTDKFLQSKFQCETFINISYLKQVLLCSISENKLGIVHFGRQFDSSLNKWSLLEPKLGLCDLIANRKNDRKISFNSSATMVAIWSKSSANEVFPWSPVIKNEERANIHIYKIIGSYEVTNTRLHLVTLLTVSPFDWCTTSVTNAWLNEDDTRLCFSYEDSVLFLYDLKLSITCSVKTAFPVEFLEWHPDGNIVAISDKNGQIQFFDSCLSQISVQPLTESVKLPNFLDLQSKVGNKKVIQLKWLNIENSKFFAYPPDAVLQLIFEKGPVVSIKLLGVGKLTADLITSMYLTENNVDCALNFLLALDWHNNGSMCLTCLQKITNYLFRLPFTPVRELQLQSAIGSFFQPVIPLSENVNNEFYEPVKHIARRFFHHLIRYELYEKAYSLAIDLNDKDLFMDLYSATKLGIGTKAMATMALEKANQFVSSDSETSQSSQSSNCNCTNFQPNSSDLLKPPLPTIPMALSQTSSIPPVLDNQMYNNITTISVRHVSNHDEYLMPTNSNLPTTTIESKSQLKYSLGQQLLSQNMNLGVKNKPTQTSKKPPPDKTIKVVHFGIV
ncbi:WD repeat-containing and planar cell polarity effector protein fritz homolog isoform X2 [Daktulosphaira vitifoliae]|uniref:WD repeat-containing and planar cell polarity effector protein fritz homolog isoform X2 n=1 Tax=Daktulosphaira vitifoliae TaxID=58002 RepID=UPI0021AA8BC0|nr:WD repeat-containing and planar cell polarity effector protein fritz homolog isoform X2 [Daktulosphaira vitifoliae]